MSRYPVVRSYRAIHIRTTDLECINPLVWSDDEIMHIAINHASFTQPNSTYFLTCLGCQANEFLC